MFYKFEKSTAILLKNAYLFPLPTQYNVENQEKLQVLVFNVAQEGGGGWGATEVMEVK